MDGRRAAKDTQLIVHELTHSSVAICFPAGRPWLHEDPVHANGAESGCFQADSCRTDRGTFDFPQESACPPVRWFWA
jgi:hypothetical protein